MSGEVNDAIRSALVLLGDPFVNTSGFIENIHVDLTPHVSHLFSHSGAVRANHWHRTDEHWAYIVRGKVLYFERPVGSTEIPKPQVFGAREKFFTPSGVEHAMLFAEDTDLITMARNVRLHEQHEADVVRVDFITPAIAAEYVR